MEEKKIFKVTDEGNTLIRSLEGTYEILYKYTEEEEAKVAEGTINRGEALAIDGKFPDVDDSKEFEYYALKVTPTGPEGWDAYASKTKIVMTLPPKKGEEEKVALSTKDSPPTKEALIQGMKDRKVFKYDELKKKYPNKIEEVNNIQTEIE